MTTDAEDVIRAMAETVERSARASSDTMRLRIWKQIDEFSKLADIEVDIAKLMAQIKIDLDKERKANKGRQRRTDYNQPPAKLRQQFERTTRTTLVKGTKDSAPAQVRYELQGPLQRYRSDLTASEHNALTSSINDYLEAQRGISITGGYGAAGGGSQGARGGGVHDKYRLAYTSALHDLTVGLLGNPTLIAIYEGLAQGSMTAEQAGKLMAPHVKDKVSLRGIGRGGIKAVAIMVEGNRNREAGIRRGTINNARNLELQITREIQARRRA